MIINPRLSSIFFITGESAISPLVMTPLHTMPEFENSASWQDNNQFAGPRSQSICKVSVKLPSDNWLYGKLEKLNLILTEGYPSYSTDTNGLSKDSVASGTCFMQDHTLIPPQMQIFLESAGTK